jgi:hypothetical protein
MSGSFWVSVLYHVSTYCSQTLLEFGMQLLQATPEHFYFDP